MDANCPRKMVRGDGFHASSAKTKTGQNRLSQSAPISLKALLNAIIIAALSPSSSALDKQERRDCRVLCRQVARVNDIEQAGELSYAIGATASGRDDSAV